MSQILECIDEIAIRLQRDILFASPPPDEGPLDFLSEPDEVDTPARRQAIEFLEAQGIEWKECWDFFSTSGILSSPYRGAIFIDVPNDETDAHYKIVDAFFEDKDGNPHFPDFYLYLLPYDLAVKAANEAHGDLY